MALASVLAERGARLLWIGARGGLESEVVPAAGIPYEESGMKRVSTGVARTVRRLVSALGAVPATRRMLRSFGADAVVGLGGYASVPVLMAARLCGVPSYLVEANAIPGAVTRRFAASASAVFSNFACARDYLPKRVLFHHTGIPIRPELAEKLASRRPPPLGGPERLLGVHQPFQKQPPVTVDLFGPSRIGGEVSCLPGVVPQVVELLRLVHTPEHILGVARTDTLP